MVIGLLIGIVVTAIICYILVKPKLTATTQLNENIIYQNALQQEKFNQLKNQSENLETDIEKKTSELHDLINKSFEAQTAMDTKANDYYKQCMSIATDRFNSDLELAEKQYNDSINEFNASYLEIMEDATAEMNKIIAEKKVAISNASLDLEAIYNDLAKFRQEIISMNESLKLAQAEKEQKDFYRIQLNNMDEQEIARIKEVAPYLRNPEALYKVIWKSYYERPFNDLIGRVIGTGKHCGIYKITNIENGMAYIGQSVDIADRWRTHVKSGLGIASTRNKLYTAMEAYGVENFTFEILEECARDQLNTQEKLWISNFDTNSYGYNMTAGGSKGEN